jgi:hypothetical protein
VSREVGNIYIRYLQTLSEIAAEQNSTILFPLPIELIEPLINSKRAQRHSPALTRATHILRR